MGPIRGNSESLAQQEVEMKFVADKLGQNVTISLAKAYTTPTDNARMTKADSVSYPVWRGGSQWSNISNTGQTRQVSKTSATATCDRRDRMLYYIRM